MAIVDIRNGAQPISNEDHTVWTVFNGELYGFEDLRRMLESKGHRFRTRTDTEIIVHLYEQYGEDFPRFLRGEFAIALYDERRSTLLLVRDRFGIKPLYYARSSHSLVFSSEMKSIFCHSDFAPEMDPENLYRMLCSVLVPTETAFKGIHQVAPGTLVKVRSDSVDCHRYWTLPIKPSSRTTRSAQEELRDTDLFQEQLTEAVKLRCHGDLPVGVYLSGGMDSAAVAALLCGSQSRKPTAFTVAFENPRFDEIAQASATARRQGLPHAVQTIGPGDLSDHFMASLWHSEMPVINTHGTAKFLLSRLAHGQAKAVLTGEGADELLLGYKLFGHLELLEAKHDSRLDLASRWRLRRFFRREGNIAGLTKVDHLPAYDTVKGLFGCYPYQALRAILHRQKLPSVLANDFLDSVRAVAPLLSLADMVAEEKERRLDSRRMTQALLFKSQLPCYLLNYLGDRQEMAHSIEARVPFLDHKLVECILTTRLAEYEDKQLLKAAVSALGYPEVALRPKAMFLAPSLETLAGNDTESCLERYLAAPIVRDAGIFDFARLEAAQAAIRYLPKNSYRYSVCEGVLVGAMSIHILHTVFCRRFAMHAERAASRPEWMAMKSRPDVRVIKSASRAAN